MNTQVDLKQLAIDRSEPGEARLRPRRHLFSRYVLPVCLLAGFAMLLAWAARDLVLPPQPVSVLPVVVSQTLVQAEGTPLFKASGWIEPRPTPIRVAALAAGVVEELLVVEDQPVKAGERVAELVKDDARLAHQRAVADSRLRQAELKEAEAALAAATTRLEQPVHLDAPLREAEGMLAKVQTQLSNLPFEIRQAQAQLEFARGDYEGKQAVAGAIAGRAIDLAKSNAETAAAVLAGLRERQESLTAERAALIARRDALKTQRELLADEIKAKDETAARVQAAQARVEQARVAAAESQLRLDRMSITAPVAGRVFRLIADPGTRVGGGAGAMQGSDGSTVVTMYRPESLQVRVDVRFQDIPKVSLRQPVKIENPALGEPLTGQVLFVSSEADIQKNTLEVKVAIDNPPPVLKPEMLVDVTFLAPEQSDQPQEPSQQQRIYVPRQYIHQGESGPFVWVADQTAGVARRVNIKTGGEAAGGLVEVTQGLNSTSRLITTGVEQLSDGTRIKVTGEAE